MFCCPHCWQWSRNKYGIMISGCTLEYLGCKTRVALETEEYQNNFLLNLADEVLKIKAPLTESWLWVQRSLWCLIFVPTLVPFVVLLRESWGSWGLACLVHVGSCWAGVQAQIIAYGNLENGTFNICYMARNLNPNITLIGCLYIFTLSSLSHKS